MDDSPAFGLAPEDQGKESAWLLAIGHRESPPSTDECGSSIEDIDL